MKRSSKLKQTLFLAAGIVLLLALLMRMNFLPSLGSIFSRKPTLIDNSSILIKEIKPLAQLVTITSYDEIVIDSIKYHQPDLADKLFKLATPIPIATKYDELVLIAHGRVIAGTNLERLRSTDVAIDKDSISILLPPSTILDIIVNPSDFETFSEKGEWESEEATILKESAIKILQQRALRQGVLQKANLQAILIMKKFLQAAGFKKTYIAIHE